MALFIPCSGGKESLVFCCCCCFLVFLLFRCTTEAALLVPLPVIFIGNHLICDPPSFVCSEVEVVGDDVLTVFFFFFWLVFLFARRQRNLGTYAAARIIFFNSSGEGFCSKAERSQSQSAATSFQQFSFLSKAHVATIIRRRSNLLARRLSISSVLCTPQKAIHFWYTTGVSSLQCLRTRFLNSWRSPDNFLCI